MKEEVVRGELGGGTYEKEGECCVSPWSLNATDIVWVCCVIAKRPFGAC
jgi:hypothetical protein